jgi:hypothetical protein
VRIDAAAMEFDYKTKVPSYPRRVVVTEGRHDAGEMLRVILDPDHPDKPREIVAEGKVQIDKGERRATGNAVSNARTVTFPDDRGARGTQQARQASATLLDEQRSVVEGTGSVRAVLYHRERHGGAPPSRAHEPGARPRVSVVQRQISAAGRARYFVASGQVAAGEVVGLARTAPARPRRLPWSASVSLADRSAANVAMYQSRCTSGRVKA